MKFGLVSSNAGCRVDPAEAVAYAVLAEELGFESLWTVEHVAIPGNSQTPYPYMPDGSIPGGMDLVMPDPLIWMAYVAAVTERIKLATGVLVLPLHHPVRLAKAVASLDRLSKGRVILGVGVGWLSEEAALLDAPWERRGARSEEQIGVLRALWRDGTGSYSGDLYRFEDVHSQPKPYRPGGPPIVIGGHSERVAARAGRIGDGFMPAPDDVDEIVRLVGIMRRAAEEVGRDPSAIEITCSRIHDLDSALRLAELGVHRLNVIPPQKTAALRPRLEAYLERVAGPLATRGL